METENNIEKEYNLKRSESSIGQLYPILVAKDGEIIDGLHREKANSSWKHINLEHIDTEEKKLMARLVANFHRRMVPYAEKKEWINKLAEIYQAQGIKSIARHLAELTGIRYNTIHVYLDKRFKGGKGRPREYSCGYAPSEEIVRVIGSHRGSHEEALELIERHRKEVIKKEKPHIIEETKKMLVQDPVFQREVLIELQKPQFVEPSERCPSGVCELPNVIKGKPPIDVVAERLKQFWKNNPQCLCKKCSHYKMCGVIR